MGADRVVYLPFLQFPRQLLLQCERYQPRYGVLCYYFLSGSDLHDEDSQNCGGDASAADPPERPMKWSKDGVATISR